MYCVQVLSLIDKRLVFKSNLMLDSQAIRLKDLLLSKFDLTGLRVVVVNTYDGTELC